MISSRLLIESDLSQITTQTADQLFENYSVQDLNQLKFRLFNEVNDKRSDLRSLVGNKYRDLLKVADDIIEMNELTKIEDSKFRDLTYKKSNYNSTKLSNFNQFNKNQLLEKVQAAKQKNIFIVLRNLINELDCLYVKFKDSLIEFNESTEQQHDSNTEDTVSIDFLQLSKLIYLIEYHFSSELLKSEFTNWKFNSIKTSFLNDLQDQLINLFEDNEYEYALNLMTSYVIVTKKLPIDSLKWFLNVRLDYFKISLSDDFQSGLHYIFNTLNYLTILRSKLPNMLTRLIYSSLNSNWVNQTEFRNFTDWLDLPVDYVVKFPITISQLKTIDKSMINELITLWKLKIGEFVYDVSSEKFNSELELSELAGGLNSLLTSFKSFTSLVDIKCSKGLLINELINGWKLRFVELLKVNIEKFNEISSIVLNNFSDLEGLENIKSVGSHGLNLFKSSVSDAGNYTNFDSSNDHEDDDGLVLNKLNDFKTELKNILVSLTSLKKLSIVMKKPVLSIDDFENDEFWDDISDKLGLLVNESIEFTIIKNLNDSVISFFNRVEKLVNVHIKPIQSFYMIRILMQFENKDVFAISSKFDELINNLTNVKFVEMDEFVGPLMGKLLKPLIKSISAPYLTQLKDVVTDRFINPSGDYPEISIWDVDDGERLLPNSCSLDLEMLMYRLSNDLISLDGEDYSDVYVASQFKDVEIELINELIDCVFDSIPEINKNAAEPVIEIKEVKGEEPVSETKDESKKDVADEVKDQATEMAHAESEQSPISGSLNEDKDVKPLSKSQKKKKKKAAAKARKDAEEAAKAKQDEADVEVEVAEVAEVAEVEVEVEVEVEAQASTAATEAEIAESVSKDDREDAVTNAKEDTTPDIPQLTEEQVKVATLLTYSDLVFLSDFLEAGGSSAITSSESFSKLSDMNSELCDSDYRSAMDKLVVDHHKSNYLMFNPL